MNEEVIKEALASFGIDAHEPISLVRESADNFVYSVGGVKKNILRLSKRLPEEDIVFEYEAVNYLAENGALVPRFLPAKSGKYHVSIDGVIAVFFEFVDGYHAVVDKDHLPNRKQVFEAGKGLAHIHNAGNGFTPSSPRHRTIFSELERAVRSEEKFTQEFEGGSEFMENVKAALQFGKKNAGHVGLIHNDYRPGNVFFRNSDELSGIIDFDWSCIAPIKKDVALGAMEWSFPDGAMEANEAIFDAFLKGYNSIATVKQDKDNKLYQWITFAALSDACTYFCDLVEDPTASKRTISSYMYSKYKFFSARIS